jgi:hypothetical protein
VADHIVASHSKTVFLSVPRGWYTRLFLRSGILAGLLNETDYRVVVLTPAYDDEVFTSEFAEPGRVFFEPQLEISGLSIGKRIHEKGLYWLRQYPKLFLQWCRSENLLSRTNHYGDLFRKYDPDIVVTATAGLHTSNDLPLLREAKRNGIQTLCVVGSWDNLAEMKGPLLTRPDKLVVWNEKMRDEACRLHFYDQADVYITGVTQFDHYFDPSIYLSRKEFCERVGFDPEKPILSLATASPVIADHRYLVDILKKAIGDGTYSAGTQLLCRVHPLDDGSLYESPNGDTRVRIETPGRHHPKLGWLPDREEDLHLANTLRHTDVLINIASTITIEAAILDRPAINVAFSTYEPERFAHHILDLHYKHNYKYIVESGATSIVWSEEELHEAVNAYLDNPELRSDKRKELTKTLCYKTDGKAGQRVMEVITSLVG